LRESGPFLGCIKHGLPYCLHGSARGCKQTTHLINLTPNQTTLAQPRKAFAPSRQASSAGPSSSYDVLSGIYTLQPVSLLTCIRAGISPNACHVSVSHFFLSLHYYFLGGVCLLSGTHSLHVLLLSEVYKIK
jgi:hypothetical protein